MFFLDPADLRFPVSIVRQDRSIPTMHRQSDFSARMQDSQHLGGDGRAITVLEAELAYRHIEAVICKRHVLHYDAPNEYDALTGVGQRVGNIDSRNL